MAGRPLKIARKHTAEEQMELYKRERDGALARRWQALWLLRRGEPAYFGEEGDWGKPCYDPAVGAVA